MSNITYHAIAVSSTMLLAGAAAAQDATPAADIAQRALDRYAELSSYSDHVVSKFDMKVEGIDLPMPEEQAEDYDFAFVKPDRFALTGSEMIQLFRQGNELFAYMESSGEYTRQPMLDTTKSKDMAGVFGGMLSWIHPVAAIMIDDITDVESFPGVTSWDAVESSDLDGHDVSKVACTFDMRYMGLGEATPATLWFDDQSHVLRRLEIDMRDEMVTQIKASMPPQVAAQVEVSKASLTMDFQRIALDERIGERRFAFVPKATDRQVKVFTLPGGDTGSLQTDLVGRPAPAASGTDLEGKTVALADLRGKVVVLDFWATWCGPCRKAIPHIQSIHQRFADKGVVVLGINGDMPGQQQRVRNFMAENSIDFRQIMDLENAFGTAFRVQSIPCTVIIDKSGVVQAIHTGFAPGDEKKLAEEIERVAKGEKLF